MFDWFYRHFSNTYSEDLQFEVDVLKRFVSKWKNACGREECVSLRGDYARVICAQLNFMRKNYPNETKRIEEYNAELLKKIMADVSA